MKLNKRGLLGIALIWAFIGLIFSIAILVTKYAMASTIAAYLAITAIVVFVSWGAYDTFRNDKNDYY